MKNFFAADIGHYRGRTYIGHVADDGVTLELLSQFPVQPITVLGHVYWGFYTVYQNILLALRKVAERGVNIESIGICAVGCDLCCFGVDGQLLAQPFSSIDPMSEEALHKFFSHMTRSELFRTNGMQRLRYLSIYQLEAMRRQGSTVLNSAGHILFIADALNYLLTGQMVSEASLVSASGLVNVTGGHLDSWLLKLMGLSSKLFGCIAPMGSVVGHLSAEVQQLTGLNDVPVVAVAGQDLASALVSAPVASRTDRFCYLWDDYVASVGLEVPQPVVSDKTEAANVSNILSVDGRTNITRIQRGGLLLNRCLDELGVAGLPVSRLADMARNASPFSAIFNPDIKEFHHATSILRAIDSYMERTQQSVPTGKPAVLKCVLDSFCNHYAEALASISDAVGGCNGNLYVLGSFADNDYVCQQLANFSQRRVVAGPVAAAATGNVMVQALASGVANNIWELRELQSRSPLTRSYDPV